MDENNMDHAFVLYAEEDYPIVGFHGRTENDRLVDLGVIWLDAKNEDCQERLPLEVQKKMMEEKIPTAQEAWDKLTEEDKNRGTDLEALMTYHSMMETKEN